jgi:uncharacterized protein (TIGR02246 family)
MPVHVRGIRLAVILGSTLVVLLTGCGGSGSDSTAARQAQHQADVNAIDQIEKTWHQAASTQDVDLMMSVWAPDATFTVGGAPYEGQAQIRQFFSQQKAFQPGSHLVSDTPAYKIRITTTGDKGTLYFQCDYIDVTTGKVVNVVAADQDVQKIDGKWLITSSAAAPTTLGP